MTHALIAEHFEMTTRVARGMARRCPEAIRDDLVSAGFVGLTEAARRWDGVQPFVPFALQRIRGAVLDEMRRGDMMPRRVRATARKVAATIKSLETSNGAPSDEQVAEKLGVSVADYRDNLAVLTQVKVDSINVENAPALVASDESPAAQIERQQLVSHVRAALEQLDKRDATLLGLRYLEEMTVQEIGLTLEISATRVCQLIKRAEARLREILDDTLS